MSGNEILKKIIDIESTFHFPVLEVSQSLALGRINNEAVIPHLLKLSDDKSIAVAEVAAEALGRWESHGKGRPRTRRPTSNLRNRTKSHIKKKSPAEERQ